jgi:hypothetical protein
MGDSMHKREENSVRVTNLSEDTREDDLRVRILSTTWAQHSLNHVHRLLFFTRVFARSR